MPTTIYFPRKIDYPRNSGVAVEYTKTKQRLYIHGWYDSCVGIEGDSLTLREFFDLLGVTEKDCAKAFKQSNAPLTGAGHD